MAKQLDTMPERPRGRPRLYPWDQWLNGDVWRLSKEEDFPTVQDAETFRMMVYAAARRMNRKAHVYIEPNNTVAITSERE